MTGVGTSETLPLGPAEYARACVDQIVRGRRPPRPPDHRLYEERAGCFVSLKKRGDLRGCIGTLAPSEPTLGLEIARNARAAAYDDPRFNPVRVDELEALDCSVDILSTSELCELTDLDPARYGVIVRSGRRRGVLLPDLDGVDSVGMQVEIALRKAGLSADEPFEVERFTVTRCHEGESADDALAALGGGPATAPPTGEVDG